MKKKIAMIMILVILSLFMTACVRGEREKSATNTSYQMLLNSGSKFVYTFQDAETGVWYISTSKGITPRLNADGSLYVDGGFHSE